jgi:RNA polymerase sigma-70 factor (ECF subfamily)
MTAVTTVKETGLTDSELVKQVLAGGRSAFAELYDRRARLIRAVCFDTTGDLHAAADLTQEVFLRAFRGLGSLADRERFAAWLIGIARQVCREWLRRKQCERKFKLRYARPEPAEAEDASRDFIDQLRERITQLPESERLALHVFYVQGMNAEEARSVLGLSRSGLYRVLLSARRRMAQMLSREVLR